MDRVWVIETLNSDHVDSFATGAAHRGRRFRIFAALVEVIFGLRNALDRLPKEISDSLIRWRSSVERPESKLQLAPHSRTINRELRTVLQ